MSPGRLFGQLVLPDSRAVGAGLPGLPGSYHSELLPLSPSRRAATTVALVHHTEPRLLLPELDVRLEVLPAIFAPLRRVTARRVLALRVGSRGHPSERTIIARVPVIDPTRFRVERMITSLVLWTRLTLTGMTHSGLSWASSGASTPWKSLQEPHQLDARLLLQRSMG